MTLHATLPLVGLLNPHGTSVGIAGSLRRFVREPAGDGTPNTKGIASPTCRRSSRLSWARKARTSRGALCSYFTVGV